MGVDAFMTAALADPAYGYYMTRDPLGRSGDFTTSPEISQIFGELIGAWCAALWEILGKPRPLLLVELGPGRGTLMADALRAFRPLPDASNAIKVHFVETSSFLKSAQAKTIARHHPDVAVTWHDDLKSVPTGPSIIIANEFFDALPIRQWIKRGAIWVERCVGIDLNGHFVFVEGSAGHPCIEPAQSREGDIFETNEPGLSIARQIGERLSRQSGAGLIIDYGHVRSACGDTFQALGKHRYAAVLEAPGAVDLTAHVDFDALIQALKKSGATVSDPITQGTFLLALGGAIRAKVLAAGKDTKTAEGISSGFDRLVHPIGMGNLFKVLGAASADIDFLPGFGPLRR